MWNRSISKFVTLSESLLHNRSYTCFFWILSTETIKFRQILCAVWYIFLTSFRPNAGNSQPVPSPSTILLKWSYSKIWSCSIVDVSVFNCLLFAFSKKWNIGILKWLVIEELEQVAKLKRAWNVAPVLQIVQTIPENYRNCLYLSVGQVWWLNELWF